jgi:ATP-dependent DNA helicase RecG
MIRNGTDMAGQLNKSIRYIRGIGEQRAKSLSKLGIYTFRDLLSFFPRTYEDRSVVKMISEVMDGEEALVSAYVITPPRLNRIRKGMDLVKFRIADNSGACDVTYFNQSYVKDSIKQNCVYFFYGKVVKNASFVSMTNPIFEPEQSAGQVTGRIMPIYRLTAGITQKIIVKAITQAFDAIGDDFPEILPMDILQKYNLAGAGFAYKNIHFPESGEALSLSRRRLIFEELFVLSCALGMMKKQEGKNAGYVLSGASSDTFRKSLPFEPTGAQKRALKQAMEDMVSGKAMNRLVQGDVGSGKTAVAAGAIWFAHQSGLQSAFMAPTEILAEQHYHTLSKMLLPFGIHTILLTGSMSARAKNQAYEMLKNGKADLVVGTHAILSEGVEFKHLALVVTDEQHRFGVRQRAALSEKGNRPHVLVMSATPIPRTLALIIYGDLDISIIDELPPGRQKVDTYLVDETMRRRINRFAERLVSEGRQVFIVCPMIEESETLDIKSTLEYAEKLKTEVFPHLRVKHLHGKMKAEEKEAVMAAFADGNIDILVSTTVIEVGVDIPNAALMIIENAERFGLSQLHQLRGRVGRGDHKSYCVLFNGSSSREAAARLKVLCDTNDGFKIAEEDLKIRGPGDFFGSRQHGLPEMKLADLSCDMDILDTAQNAARLLLRDDPELKKPENAALQQRVSELFEIGLN